MTNIRRNTRIRLLDEEEDVIQETRSYKSYNENYNDYYDDYDYGEDDGYSEEDAYEDEDEDNVILGSNSTRVSRKVRVSRKNSEPWSKGKRILVLILVLIVCAIVGWFVGVAVANKADGVLLNDDIGLSDQELILHDEINKICESISNGDTTKVQDKFIVSGTNSNISKEEAKVLIDYFEKSAEELKDDKVNQHRDIRNFTSKLKLQVEAYLGDNLNTENKYFYLAENKNKLCVAVNKPNLNLLVRTDKDVKIQANGTDVTLKDKRVNIPNVFPVKVLVESTYGDDTETLEVDLLKSFLTGNEFTGDVTQLVLKHGVGLKAGIYSNAPEGDIYVNGNLIDTKIEGGVARIDGLKEGDTIRVKYKNKMSKEEKMKNEDMSFDFEFDLSEFELRFNLPKRLVDDLENKTRFFLNSVGNAVGSQNNGVVLSGLADNGDVQGKASLRLFELISNYNSLLFTNINVTNATQAGDSTTITISYSFDTIDKTGGQELANGSCWIKFNSSGEIIDFSL